MTYSGPVPAAGQDRDTRSELRAELENHLPATLPVGCGTAIFLYGHCFHRTEQIQSMELLVGVARHRPTATGMARRDLFEWLHGPARDGVDPHGHSYRSGFWATLPVPAQDRPGPLEIRAAVRLNTGDELSAPLGQIEIVSPPPPPARKLSPETIAVCLATYEPDLALLKTQLQSLRDQTDRRWVCVISDGCSSPERYRQLTELVAGDQRFSVSRSPQRLEPYRNFERALALAPADAELLAPCDQDDRWYPEKLEVLRAALGRHGLVYSDQRLVSDEGRVLAESLWHGRRNDYENLASLLVANTMPGAAMLMRREVVRLALPFPDAPGIRYHDHWLALVALAAGDVGYVDQPLYDYVQHAGAVQGSTRRPGDASATLGSTPRRLRSGSRGWRGAYFGGYLNRQVWACALLVRRGSRLTTRKRRALAWFVAADRSPLCFSWLALRPLRHLIGRDETLGGELALAAGILWRALITVAVGRARAPGRRAYDTSFPDPPRFEQRRLRRWRAGS